jgi:hypothetical protein
MAPSESLAIERLGAADVDAGLRLSDAARWNQTAEDWAHFIAHGDAFGIRDDADGLIATAAASPYGANGATRRGCSLRASRTCAVPAASLCSMRRRTALPCIGSTASLPDSRSSAGSATPPRVRAKLQRHPFATAMRPPSSMRAHATR